MGRAKAVDSGVNVQAELREQQGDQPSGVGTAGLGEILGITASLTPDSTIAPDANAGAADGGSDDSSNSKLSESQGMDPMEPVAPEYEVPSWAEFRTFVMDNGDKYVRATYPNPPVDLIETIWCGVPVEHHDHARVMSAKSEWLVY